MAIEYQGGGTNSIFQDNWYEKARLGSSFNENNETFAYSIIADRSHGTIARRNVVIAPERPDGVGVRIAFEIGGDNALVEDNYISGVNHVLAANDNYGSTSVTARNNFFEKRAARPRRSRPDAEQQRPARETQLEPFARQARAKSPLWRADAAPGAAGPGSCSCTGRASAAASSRCSAAARADAGGGID